MPVSSAHSQNLRGKSLVEFDDIDVSDLHRGRSRTFATASIGPTPMISGASAETEEVTIRARGVIPIALAASASIMTTAAAPSLRGHALPAVTTPSDLKTGSSVASFSTVVPRRGRHLL